MSGLHDTVQWRLGIRNYSVKSRIKRCSGVGSFIPYSALGVEYGKARGCRIPACAGMTTA